jgi:hypothetical protein
LEGYSQKVDSLRIIFKMADSFDGLNVIFANFIY